MRRSCGTSLSLALAVFAAACGGDDSSGDVADAAPPDAVLADAGPLDPATCPTSYGTSTVFSTLEVVEDEDIGFDLDGDSQVDNAMFSTAGLLNMGFKDDIDSGLLRSLIELRDLDSLTGDDSSVRVVLYGGIDSDDPADTADDFDGNEDYKFNTDWVEREDCAPRAVATGTLSGGTLDASADSLIFYVESLGGFLEFGRVKVSFDPVANGKGFGTPDMNPGLFGGAIKLCSLNNGQTILGRNSLHALAQFLGTQPDIDMDGDGLETIQTDSSGILSCTDGDGTVIPGEMCGCDPRMGDGYSITLAFDTVGAGIVGPGPIE